MPWKPRYGEVEVRDAVANSPSLAGALRSLGLRAAGANHRTLKRHITHYGICTAHFNPNWALRGPRSQIAIPLEQILVERSDDNRGARKRRLYDSNLKQRFCELCGQGELWRGHAMSLILDHVNGVHNDNRLENLRIVCPNCAATFDTHCGRKNRVETAPRERAHCRAEFIPRYAAQRFCSQPRGVHSKGSHDPRPETRKVSRPPYEQLIEEVRTTNFSAVGRKHGVSGNAVRKWIRWYEAGAGRRLGEEAPPGSFSNDRSPTILT